MCHITDDRLRELYEGEWVWRRAQLGGQSLSSHAPIDPFLPDVGEEAQVARRQHWEWVLEELATIDPAGLSPAARVDAAVYQQQITTLAGQQRNRMYERPANADSAFWSALSDRGGRPLETEEDARNQLRQLADIPRYFEQQMDNMRRGVERGFGPPQVSMAGREATIRTVAEARSPEETRFFRPYDDLPAVIAVGVQDDLRQVARDVITNAVIPAYVRLLDFFLRDYYPRLPTAIAAHDGPDGIAFYRDMLREFTTTDLTPQEIFDIGLAEVQSLRQEMEEIAGETGFAGDMPGLLAFMRTDAQFYATSAEGLLREAAWQAKKFDAQVHRFFGRTPRMRFGIEEPPPDLAPYYTFGRGGLDRYILNTYNLPARPLYSLPALTLHEAAPGHAFQMPFALEQTQHPAFRRQVYISAYGEGWALYCERLGVEMGMYATAYEVMGMLSFQMWRAVRLVIDPGLHAFGWSREKAQAFLRDNTAIAEHEIVTEVDRYIAWPGQACAYYLGELKILELRQRSEAALGGAFSLRNFHDAVLALGSVPLTVLESEIDRFIAEGGRSPFDAEQG